MRLFRCRDCGHKMRLSGSRCGKCYTPKAVYQRSALIAFGAAVLGVGGPLLAVLFLAPG